MKISQLKPRWFLGRGRLQARRRGAESIGRAIQPLEARRLLAAVPALVALDPNAFASLAQPLVPGSDQGSPILVPEPHDHLGAGESARGPILAFPIDMLGGPPANAAGSMLPHLELVRPSGVPLGGTPVIGPVPDATSQLPPPSNDHETVSVATVSVNGVPTTEVADVNEADGRVTVYQGSTVVFSMSDLTQPSAVKLADLNDDGTPDLIIAEAATNRVLVFPGQATGGFGTELAGGKGFAVGDDPVGLTVGDMNNDGRSDLIVANKGSNNVSILTSQGTGSDWTLSPQTLVAAGIAPVKTILVDSEDGSSTRDLIICNSGSNDIYDYKVTTDGQVVAGPTKIPVAKSPSDMFVGQFSRRTGDDLVTLNADSDRATFIGGVFTSHPFRQDISTGIMHPVAALSVSVGDSGTSDLMVAGSDGRIAFLQAGDNVLELTGLTAPTGLSNITAITAGDSTSGGFDLYESLGSSDSVAILRFNLDEFSVFATAPAADLATTISASGDPLQVELVPTGGSMLSLVGVLWNDPNSSATDETSSSRGSTGTWSVGQSLKPGGTDPDANTILASSRSDEDEDAGADDEMVPWTSFVLGLDAALDSFQEELAAIAAADASDHEADQPFEGRGFSRLLADRSDRAPLRPEPMQSVWLDPPHHSPFGGDEKPAVTPVARLLPIAEPGVSSTESTELVTAVLGSGVAVRFLVNVSPPRPTQPRPRTGRARPGSVPIPAWPEVFPPMSPHG